MAQAICDAHNAAHPTESAGPAPAEIEADARRYRWLREALDNEQVTERLHEAFQQGSTALDAAIDAALGESQ